MADITKIELNGNEYSLVDSSAIHTVDSALSTSSTNPVQNKVVTTALNAKENTSNKVTSLLSTSTDTQYPSAKAVYDETYAIRNAYVKKSGDTMSGNLKVLKPIVTDGNHINDNIISFYESNDVTGTIKITLPQLITEFDMPIFHIFIYEYNEYASSEIIIGGHNWVSGSSHSWYNSGYAVVGAYDKGVRLANDGTNWVILLGTTTTAWKYPEVHLKTVFSRYTDYSSKWGTSDYSITRITSETGLQEIFTPTLKTLFPLKNGTGASGIWGISITGNAATATTLTTNPTIQDGTENTSAITVTVGGKTSGEYIVPYAVSSATSGYANSAGRLSTSSAGSGTQPVYFASGNPVACTYSLNKTVPANAVFTDTTYTLTNALASHKFTWTLTPSSGSTTTTTAELVQGTGITLTDDTTNKKITIANSGVTSITTSAGAHTTKSDATGAVSFNVPTKTSHLTNDSGFITTHQTLYEENIYWGPTTKNGIGTVSPIGMALSSEHSSNRIAFINGDALNFEYSSDGGATYTNYGYGKSDKSKFCTTSLDVPIGRPNNGSNCTTLSRTRVTLTAQDGTNEYLYTSPKKMLIRVSSACGMQVLIEYRSGTNYQNNGAWSTYATYTVSGWSGWNDIPLILGTLGGDRSQPGNYWQLRLTFIITSVSSSYPATASVVAIRLFGDNAWYVTSNMGTTGHLYGYDIDQNAIFPASVTAHSGFYGTLVGDVVGNASTATTASKLGTNAGSSTNPVYFSGGVPVACTYSLNKTVPSDAVFTDTTYTFDGTYDASTNKAATVSTVTNYAPAKDGTGATGTWSINISGGANSANSAITATDASNLLLSNSNEVTIGCASIVGGSTNSAVWINYRDRSNGTINNASTQLTDYYFGNRKGATTGITIHAANFDGLASSASTLGSANLGASNKPIYLVAGVPTAFTYELNKTVPSDAVFTDANVTQTLNTSNSDTTFFPILLTKEIGQSATATGGTNFTTHLTCSTSGDVYGKNFNGTDFVGTKFKFGTNAYLQYNSSESCIDVLFA